MGIVWELQRGAWTCPFSTMEVRSEARWKRFPSPDLPSDHICCVTEREQNRGFCNLMPLQHQTTGTNKATSHGLERHKNSRKRAHDHAVGPFSSLHFVKLTFRPVDPKQRSVKTSENMDSPSLAQYYCLERSSCCFLWWMITEGKNPTGV